MCKIGKKVSLFLRILKDNIPPLLDLLRRFVNDAVSFSFCCGLMIEKSAFSLSSVSYKDWREEMFETVLESKAVYLVFGSIVNSLWFFCRLSLLVPDNNLYMFSRSRMHARGGWLLQYCLIIHAQSKALRTPLPAPEPVGQKG